MFKITAPPEKLLIGEKYHFLIAETLMLPSTKFLTKINRPLIQIELDEAEFSELLKVRRDEKFGDEDFWDVIEDITKNKSKYDKYNEWVGVNDLEVYLEIPVEELKKPVPYEPTPLHQSHKDVNEYLNWGDWNVAGDQPLQFSNNGKKCLVRTNIGAVVCGTDEIVTLIKYSKREPKVRILNTPEFQKLIEGPDYRNY